MNMETLKKEKKDLNFIVDYVILEHFLIVCLRNITNQINILNMNKIINDILYNDKTTFK